MRKMIVLLALLLLLGCSSQAEKPIDSEKTIDIDDNYDLSKINGNLLKDDQTFIRALEASAAKMKIIIVEFDEVMTEAQEHDEYHGALEVMEETESKVLYEWNSIHNGYSPEHPELQKLQRHYEGILEMYKQGIGQEWEGMSIGDGGKMKEGFKNIERAKEDFAKLSKDIKLLKGS